MDKNNNTTNSRNEMLDAIDEKLDQAGDAVEDTSEDVGNWLSKQWYEVKHSYHDMIAKNSDKADVALENRMKATQAKAKAAGYELKD